MAVNDGISKNETFPWLDNYLLMLFFNKSLIMWFQRPEEMVGRPMN